MNFRSCSQLEAKGLNLFCLDQGIWSFNLLYPEEGFKQVSRDIMEESLGSVLVKEPIQVKKSFISEEMRKIYNIVMAMAEFMGIHLDTEYDYIANQVIQHLNLLPSEKDYNTHIARLKKRQKKPPKYKIYYPEPRDTQN